MRLALAPAWPSVVEETFRVKEDQNARRVCLPGGSQIDIQEIPVPEPAEGQVRIAVRASTICGSDLRAIYREVLGDGPEAYRGAVGGHEPVGRVGPVSPGVRRMQPGDLPHQRVWAVL